MMVRLFGSNLKLLKLDQIEMDTEFYPRERTSWIVSYKYSQAMKSGEKFPPITVAEFDGRFVLVDGWHRMEATKLNKEKFIQTEILKGLTPQEIYVEAVRRNTKHGQPLTTTEVTNIIIKLQDMRISLKDISSIVHMPMEKIKPFVQSRVTSAITGEPIILKKPLYHLAGRDTGKIKGEYEIDSISGMSQTKILDEVILLLSNSWIDLRDEQIVDKLTKIYYLLDKKIIVKSKRKKKKAKRKSRK